MPLAPGGSVTQEGLLPAWDRPVVCPSFSPGPFLCLPISSSGIYRSLGYQLRGIKTHPHSNMQDTASLPHLFPCSQDDFQKGYCCPAASSPHVWFHSWKKVSPPPKSTLSFCWGWQVEGDDFHRGSPRGRWANFSLEQIPQDIRP